MTTNTVRVGQVTLTRVGYVDVTIPPERVGLTAEQIASVPWAEPLWAEGDQLRAGAAVWVIESGDARIAVDPAQAADEILRTDADAVLHQKAFADLMDAAGFPRESITHDIASHVEGIGMHAWRNDDGSWSPFFPNAVLLAPKRELDALDAGEHPTSERPTPAHPAFDQLREAGVVHGIDDGAAITDEVRVEHVGTHAPGLQFVRVSSYGEQAVLVSHLAVSPLHLVTGPCPQQHYDPDAAQARIDALLHEDAVLIGPLWPEPGAGRWDGRQLVPELG